MEEGIIYGFLWVIKENGALSKVIHYERGIDQTYPIDTNRFAAKVAHICKHCLAPSNAEYYGAEQDPRAAAVAQKEVDSVPGIESFEYLWRSNDMTYSYKDIEERGWNVRWIDGRWMGGWGREGGRIYLYIQWRGTKGP